MMQQLKYIKFLEGCKYIPFRYLHFGAVLAIFSPDAPLVLIRGAL
jgi:hypothetical protein